MIVQGPGIPVHHHFFCTEPTRFPLLRTVPHHYKMFPTIPLWMTAYLLQLHHPARSLNWPFGRPSHPILAKISAPAPSDFTIVNHGGREWARGPRNHDSQPQRASTHEPETDSPGTGEAPPQAQPGEGRNLQC